MTIDRQRKPSSYFEVWGGLSSVLGSYQFHIDKFYYVIYRQASPFVPKRQSKRETSVCLLSGDVALASVGIKRTYHFY